MTVFAPQIPDSLCLLRLSAIGDVCHALALVQRLQEEWPSCKITWVVGKAEHQLLRHLIDCELIVFDKKAGIKGYIALWKVLRKRRFDVLLHMQTAIRASLASVCVRAKRRIGFARERAKELQWLFTNEHIYTPQKTHVADNFMAFSEHLGLAHRAPQWQLPPLPEVSAWVKKAALKMPYVLICPCASKAERNWSVAGYRIIVDDIVRRGFHVILCTGPSKDEVKTATAIAQDKNIQNLAGQTSLIQLLEWVRHASFVIAPDSGPTHMAVIANTPVISLYAHSNPQRTGPYHFRDYCISHYEKNIENQYGKNASELPWGTRAKGSLMNEISVEEVREKIELLLADFSINGTDPYNN